MGEFENCLPDAVPDFYKKFRELDADTTGTIVRNIRFGCFEKTFTSGTVAEIVNYNSIKVANEQCKWSFDPLYVDSNLEKKFALSDELKLKTPTNNAVVDYKTPTEVCSGTTTDTTGNAQNKVWACYGGADNRAAGAKGPGFDLVGKKRLAGSEAFGAQPKESAFTVLHTASGTKYEVTVISKFTTQTAPTAQADVTVTMNWMKQDGTAATPAGCQTEGVQISAYTNVQVAASLGATFANPVGPTGSFTNVPGKQNVAWDPDNSKYSIDTDGTCTYTCDEADIVAGKCNVGCGLIEVDRPMPCEHQKPTIEQCGKDQECDDPLLRLKTAGLAGFNNVIDEVDTVNMYYAKPFGFSCAGEDKEAQCKGGRAMYDVVNCGFIVAFARESYDSICTMMVGGLMSMATGFLMFFLGYNMAFFTFLLGYKRWNTNYTEGYRVDLDGDGKTAGEDDGDKKGFVGAMCDSLKQGCKGQYRPKVGDQLVFADGEQGHIEVDENMATKKSGYQLAKTNTVVPESGL